MDFKQLVEKAKQALGKNPSLIDKAGDFVDSKTDGKYADKVNKVEDAARKFAGGQNQAPQNQAPQAPAPQNDAPQGGQPGGEQRPGQ